MDFNGNDLGSDLAFNVNNQSYFELDEDFEYPSLEVVEAPFQIGLVTVFSITATLSLTGNITVIIVLVYGHRTSKELKSFIINLAVADVLMALFSIPFSYTMFLLGRWIFQPWFCPVAMTMQHLSVMVSVYTLVAIAFDRYRAIADPLGTRATASKNGLVILGIWTLSFLISSVQLVISEAKPFKYDRQWYYDCRERWTSISEIRIYTVFVFCVTFLLPMTALAFAYSAIGIKLWRNSAPGNLHKNRDSIHLKAKWKIIKMLLMIVLLFSACWLPLQIFILLSYFRPGFTTYDTTNERRTYALSFFACLWLANANSFVNPLVYCFMSDNFRRDLKIVYRKFVTFLCCQSRTLNQFGSTQTRISLDSFRSHSKSQRRKCTEAQEFV